MSGNRAVRLRQANDAWVSPEQSPRAGKIIQAFSFKLYGYMNVTVVFYTRKDGSQFVKATTGGEHTGGDGTWLSMGWDSKYWIKGGHSNIKKFALWYARQTAKLFFSRGCEPRGHHYTRDPLNVLINQKHLPDLEDADGDSGVLEMLRFFHLANMKNLLIRLRDDGVIGSKQARGEALLR